MKVSVTKVNWKNDIKTSYGTSSKIGILTQEHGDKWLGCFENKMNSKQLRAIQEGHTIDIIVEPNGDFLNFRFKNKFDYLEDRVAALEASVFGTGKAAEEVDTQPEEDPGF